MHKKVVAVRTRSVHVHVCVTLWVVVVACLAPFTRLHACMHIRWIDNIHSTITHTCMATNMHTGLHPQACTHAHACTHHDALPGLVRVDQHVVGWLGPIDA